MESDGTLVTKSSLGFAGGVKMKHKNLGFFLTHKKASNCLNSVC